MLLRVIFSAAFLALSVSAAAVPAAAKTFKFQVQDPAKGIWYLADATGAGTQDKSKAISCELAGDVIKCGGKGFPEFDGDMTRLEATGNSTGWSIDASDNIHWNADPDMKFSMGLGSDNDVWAEVCPHHWSEHGTAKAIWS
ncbi:hypothetical protein GQ53DRAFT_838122 [Thozetella sp. PMI_491]|nr:hypothetical protein GQ53DRAFT_838122 [Thozetella sp. PMI_491]